jgi:hypothetical protein
MSFDRRDESKLEAISTTIGPIRHIGLILVLTAFKER